MSDSRILDLNRNRASISYSNIKEFLDNNKDDDNIKKKMKSYCRKLPVLIKTNGLLATILFIKNKSNSDEKKNAYSYIYSWIDSWFNEFKEDKSKNLIETIIDLDAYKYSLYTKELIELSIWYRRHVDAMIKD